LFFLINLFSSVIKLDKLWSQTQKFTFNFPKLIAQGHYKFDFEVTKEMISKWLRFCLLFN